MNIMHNHPTFRPNYILLELTTRCNLRCIMCSVNDDKRLQKGGEWYGDLDSRVLSNLESVYKNIVRIDLNGSGESLLSPLFLELLKKIKKNNAKAFVGLTTNALLLDKTIAEEMVIEKLDEVIISIHAAEPTLYAEISKHGAFNKLVDNITTLNLYKEQYHTNLPVLKINFVAMKKNIHQLEDLLHLAKKLNVSELAVLHLAEYSCVKGESLIHYPDLIKTYFSASIECAKDLGIILHIPELYLNILRNQDTVPSGTNKLISIYKRLLEFFKRDSLVDPLVRNCMDPWDFLFILQSGRVRPCCVLENNMGNLSEQTFEEIWQGDKYKELRSNILSNTPPKGCVTCSSRPLTRLSCLKKRVSTKTNHTIANA